MCFLLDGWFAVVLTSKTEEYDHKILLFNEVIEILIILKIIVWTIHHLTDMFLE